MKSLMLLCSLISIIPAAQIKGKVVGVKTGNEIELLSDGKILDVKIFGIDGPARKFAKGKEARHYIATSAFMNDVQLDIMSVESEGIFIGKVTLPNGKDLAVEMLKQGLVWWDKQNSPDEVALAKVEKQAREGYYGIWSGSSKLSEEDDDTDDDVDWGRDVLVKRDLLDKEKTEGGLLTAANSPRTIQ